ncbi:MAG: hypothetical protein ACKVOR_08645 [Flavobacteriales bacterium]
MFKLIRLVIRIALLLFVLLIVAALFTNPSLDEFKQEVRSRMKAQFDQITSDPTMQTIAGIGAGFADDLVEKMVTRKNYYVCSVYTIETPAGNYEYLGAFHMFYPLQDEDPMEKFFNTIQELNK